MPTTSAAPRVPRALEAALFTNFYPAEDYHQDYYVLNGHAPYCQLVIAPKLEKFHKVFGARLKPGS